MLVGGSAPADCPRVLGDQRSRTWGPAGRTSRSDLPDVGGLQPLRAAGDLELDPIALGQALEALRLDGAEVHEDILAVFLGNESVALRIVEPLHAALSHLSLPSFF